ncbi:MAG TPA: peptidyl-prolyl cis-trans isomerase [Pyrinomonadaceae bacterium]|jgi:peptidyl-prolyl cis-trans isomerase D|nr:peptidyl-prolyl cis-trans isomerase [Pyrinomonadaceae bacterium]
MLKLFSRLERTRSLIIIFFAALVVIGMVVTGVYNRTGIAVANPFKSREVLAKVNGDEVTVADLALRKKSFELRMGGQFSLAQLGMTNERILDQLINDRIAYREAERLGLKPSEEEVRDSIRQQFSDASTPFDLQRYKDYVVRNFGSTALYEEAVRRDLAVSKLRAFVTAGAQVSDEELRRDYERDNTSLDLVYVSLTAEELAKKVAVADDELRQYFDAHKTDYRLLEPQKKIRYLFINTEKAGSKLQISDEDLRKEYDSLKPESKMAGVRVQQIVLKVATPELDQEVLGKATNLVNQIRQPDLTATEEAFANLARGNSEDPATAQSGGWMPAPVKRDPNRKGAPKAGDAAALAEAALDWKDGQVGDPLKTGNAYYIFRRGPVVPKSFEDAKQELLVSLRNRRSYGVAQELAQRAVERLNETKDVQKVAQELAASANMTPAEMVRETPFIKPQDDVPEIGSSPQFEEAIRPLEEPGQVGGRVGIKNGFAVPVLVEKRDPRIPEFEEVKEQVAERLKSERATQQLEQAAKDLAARSASPDALKAEAAKIGLTAETEENYRAGRPLGKAGADPALDAAVIALKSGETTKAPVKVGDSWVVAGVTNRKDADMAEFDKKKSELLETALTTRRSEAYDEYITAARRKLEQDNKVQINREVMAEVEALEPAAAPRPPFNFPPPGE